MSRRLHSRVIEVGGCIVALLLPLVFNPWAVLPFEPVKVIFLRLMVVGILVISTPLALYHWRQTPFDRPHLVALFNRFDSLGGAALFYGMTVLIATYASTDPNASLWGGSDGHGALTTWCGLLLYLGVSAVIHNQKQVMRLLLTCLVGSTPVCIYGFAQFLQLDPLPWVTDSVSPVLSTLGRSNFLAAYLAVLLPLTLVVCRQSWQQPLLIARVGSTLLVIVQMMCLLLTQARAGWLAFMGGVSVLLWSYGWRQSRQKTGVRISLFVLLSGAIFIGFNPLITRSSPAQPQMAPAMVVEPSFAEQRSASMERRLIIWRHTVPLIQERWLVGFGPETFVTVFNTRYPPGTLYAGTDILITDPHNLLLKQWVTIGGLGATAWLILILKYFGTLARLLRSSNRQTIQHLAAGLGGSMCAYLIQAQFNPDVIVLETLFWLLLTLTTGLYKQARRAEWHKNRQCANTLLILN